MTVAPDAGPSPVPICRFSARMRLFRIFGRNSSEGNKPHTSPPMCDACETRFEASSEMAFTVKNATKSTMHSTRRNGQDIDSKLTTKSATNSPINPNTAPEAPTSRVQLGSNAALTRLAPIPACMCSISAPHNPVCFLSNVNRAAGQTEQPQNRFRTHGRRRQVNTLCKAPKIKSAETHLISSTRPRASTTHS